jgi:ankyrin repeat protein
MSLKKYWPIIKDGIILLSITTLFVKGVSEISKSLKKTNDTNPIVTAINQDDLKGVTEALSEESFKAKPNAASSLQEFNSKLVNGADEQLRTPLMWLAYVNTSDQKAQTETDAKRTPILETLVQKGADLNARDEHGWTPLMWASWSGLTKISTRLIELGANTSVTDRKGNTALMLAALRGNTEIVEFLVARGADKNFATSEGKTAKDFAQVGITEHPAKAAEYQKILQVL